jgi:RNase P subunit RPR2
MQIGVPWSRYHTAVCYVGWEHLLFDLLRYVNEFENIRKHVDAAALMFGGDMNLLQNNYVDDMWILSFKQQVHLRTESELKRRRDEACKILLYPSKYENNRWDWTCGVLSDIHSSEPCLWEDVLLMAWCLGQYQSFTSPV